MTQERTDSQKSRSTGGAASESKPHAPRQRMKPNTAFAMDGGIDHLGGDDTQFVGAIARALAVMDTFRSNDGPLGNSDIAERTNLPKPTVSRITYTLARCGYLVFDPRHRVYELGPSALALGHVAMNTMDVRQLARPLMQALARDANFNVGLGTRDGRMMIYTDASDGEALIGLRLFAGSRIPIMTSAMGRAYLAALENSHRQDLLEDLKHNHGDEWPKLRKSLDDAICEYERYGFCTSVGEWQSDIHGVAAPIRCPGDGRVYAINLGGPAYLLPEAKLRGELGERIVEAAAQVESAMTAKAVILPDRSAERSDGRTGIKR